MQTICLYLTYFVAFDDGSDHKAYSTKQRNEFDVKYCWLQSAKTANLTDDIVLFGQITFMLQFYALKIPSYYNDHT